MGVALLVMIELRLKHLDVDGDEREREREDSEETRRETKWGNIKSDPSRRECRVWTIFFQIVRVILPLSLSCPG